MISQALGYVLAAVTVLLVVSAGANYVLYSAAQEHRDRATQAEASRDAFKAAAGSCTASVSAYRAAADAAVRNAQAELARANARAGKLEASADRVLAAAPSLPGDDCGSASVLLRGWLEDRPDATP